MKITELNLNKPHYIIQIATTAVQANVNKQTSIIVKDNVWDFYFNKTLSFCIVPKKIVDEINTNHYYIIIDDINENIYEGNKYYRFNLLDKKTIYYITYDKHTACKLLFKYYLKEYYVLTKMTNFHNLAEYTQRYCKQIIQKVKSMK